MYTTLLTRSPLLSCILVLLVDDLCRAFNRWFLDLHLDARCGTLFDYVLIRCGIDTFFMVHMLRRMGVGSTSEENH